MFSLKVPDVFKELFRKVFVKPEERKLALCLGEKRLRDEKRFLYHRARARRQFNTSKKKMNKVLKSPPQAGSERKSEPRLIKDIMNEMIRTSDEPIARVLRQLNLQQP